MKSAIRGLVILAAAASLAVGLSAVAGSPAAASPPPTAAPAVTAHPYVHHKTAPVCSTVRRRGTMNCFSIRQTDAKQPKAFHTHAVVPNATPDGYSPASLELAYKLPTTGGSGNTVAIVDAYNDPTAAADLTVYRSQYGLPACGTGCLSIVNQNGATSPLPANNTGWAGEESLDLDMVSAICPSCHIELVEANSASNADLYAAEDRAASTAKFVSNSWGGSEYSGQTTDDAHFNHPGVAITASSGDDATGAAYPATSRYVTAVGGTTLTSASNTRGWTETAWGDAGSGCSSYDTKATWQTVPTGSCTRRAEADVSAVADPSTGVAVYQTYGASGWNVYGGTSVAAPIIAGVYALAGTPTAGTYPASYPYAHQGNLFDVTSGSNGSCGAPICAAGNGWDGPTGLGTPNGTLAFAAGSGGTPAVTVTNPGNKTATVGTAFALQLAATGGSGTYSWVITGLPAGLTATTAGAISGTPTAPGTSTVTASATSSGMTGTASFTITVSSVGGGCTAAQKLGNPGFETGSAAPWTSTAGVVNPNGAGETSHGGTYYAWLDGYGTTHTDTLSQSVTIPAGCTASTLSFWLHVDTAETTTTTQFDKLTVTVGTTTEAVYSNLNHVTGYVQHTFNVGAFAGQTVAVKFSGTEDSSLQTSFVVDDTALNVS